ncbi:hypothetical protein P168DRAFT_302363 [Aspergillus campestris IBT 28561]|uniref:Uncharacterized protein n=1 Tax=Aspergillus campestris (strain IBT 28561) TaxID=1392248 RepID=A0A2I1DC33_ASPC2|nr:uncharacterized protein P168DRAFT_302363 [Aspergillus campestris IBT 28561]PKY07436.1 hypothetical protein P168DRAFT_302363 [Aspergillus campestris IBT 28561]
MALVVSSPPDIRAADPTLSLKQALTDFGDILTEEQKRQFQVSSTKPDVSSVIAFVGEIDANNSSTTRRCVAPRLYTFLDALQQFSRVVDTFVSSNPAIAALIWGGVKTAILTASNVASYFDKITSMVMAIGRSCPTYQQFGQLYPGCVALQRALCDYYAVIIQMCIKIIEISRRTAITQTLSSVFFPFDTEFKSFQDNLDQATKEIQLQISLASQKADKEARKLLEHESQVNTSFRRRLFKKYEKEHAEAHQWRIDMLKREAAKLKLDIKTNLSTIDHTKPWKQATKQRVPSTAEWLLQEPLFRQWKDSPDAAIFWCSGTMGVGKTVLMSNVVTQLNASRKSNDVISYYFCRGDDAVSLTSRSIIGSLARQLLEQEIDHAKGESLWDLHKDSCGLDTSEVVNFMLSRLKANRTYYLLLDGLDECDNSQIEKVAWNMTRLCDKRPTNFKIICAGRPELEKQLFRVIKPKFKLSVTERKIKADMDNYIDTILGRCLEEELLKLQDPKLIIDISKALRDGSHGMFLWTRLFVEELCAQGSDNDILTALKHLPRGLSEIFDRKIRRLRERPAAKEAMKILEFCNVVKRPLSVMEYQEVLSLSPGQKSLDRGKMPNDMISVVSDCCGLTFIDEEDSTVHYVHHSVKQHLSSINSLQSGRSDLAKIDQHFGFLCMTYLDSTDFKRQLAKTREGSNIPIKPLHLGTLPIRHSRRSASSIALKLLSHSRQLQHLNTQELERKTQDILGDLESSRLESEIRRRQFHFFDYAWTYWVDHTTDLDPDADHMIWKLFCRPWESEQQNNDRAREIPNAIQWLITYGHYTLFQYHARCQPHILTEIAKQEVIQQTAIHNRYRFTELIIQQHGTSSELLGSLQAAAEAGHLEIVMSLLAAGAGTHALDTALEVAAKAGHLEIVKRLLAAGDNTNASGTRHGGQTALYAASEARHGEIVETLLAAGVLWG